MRIDAALRDVAAGAGQAPQGVGRRGSSRIGEGRNLDLLLRTPQGSEGAVRLAVLSPHLALPLSAVERVIPFYEALFGTAPEKVKPGYAKFSVTEPAINF